tara:strand:- start:325 stop:570 length:246 start_codon:yes stop_codon:yes gene_type:complete
MEYLSLYDYLNKAAGAELGKRVATEATKRSIPVASREIDNPKYTGKVMMYPKAFLDDYFGNSKTTKPEPPRSNPEVDDLPF